MKTIGEYYVEWDEVSASYCVFHTDDVGRFKSGHAFASFASKEEAEREAARRNELRQFQVDLFSGVA